VKKVFDGKKAVIVGGTGGIGRAISLSLAAEGSEVRAIGRHALAGVNSLILELDNPENRTIVVDEVLSADILCVVRGPFLQKHLHEMTSDEWLFQAYANLGFPGMLVSAVLPHMRASGWGRILLLGGTRTDSVRGFRTNAAYAAAKTGLSSLVKSVALEYALQGITCNAICPGFVETEYLDSVQKNRLAEKSRDGKLISTQDIADLAMFLLKNTLYNGCVVLADKGWSPELI